MKCVHCEEPLPDDAGFCSRCGRPVAPLAPRLPRLDRRYDVLGNIGTGGFGDVVAAWDLQQREVVAIKIPRQDTWSNEKGRKRFHSEAMSLNELDHPNIVQFLDWFDDESGRMHLVLEFMDAGSLEDLMRAEGGIRLVLAAAIVREASLGVHDAHQRGIIHRDLKPANILLSSLGQVKVADFGIALRLSDPRITKGLLGSFPYMAPELVAAPVDPGSVSEVELHRVGTPSGAGFQSDQYSLGVTLFEALTGSLPFDGNDPGAIITGHLRQAPPDPRTLEPDIPPALSRVILRSLEKAPGRRFPDLSAFAAGIDAALPGLDRVLESWRASPPDPVHPFRDQARRLFGPLRSDPVGTAPATPAMDPTPGAGAVARTPAAGTQVVQSSAPHEPIRGRPAPSPSYPALPAGVPVRASNASARWSLLIVGLLVLGFILLVVIAAANSADRAETSLEPRAVERNAALGAAPTVGSAHYSCLPEMTH